MLAIVGAGAGVVMGFFLSEVTGGIDGQRLRRVVGRIRGQESDPDLNPEALLTDVESILASDDRSRGLDVTPSIVGDGIIELTGLVSDVEERDLVGRIVGLGAPSSAVVINRVLIEGVDVPSNRPRTAARGQS